MSGRYDQDVDDLDDAEPEGHRHRDVQSGGARAAVFGMSDGLVTKCVADPRRGRGEPRAGIVRADRLRRLIAVPSPWRRASTSPCSAAGTAQRELDTKRRALPRAQAERDELLAIYTKRGIDVGVASELVDQVMQDPELALETHAREELGINPDELGRPLQAAVSSFFTFAVGAFLPLIPWLFTSGTAAIIGSVVIGVIASLAVGALLGSFTGARGCAPPCASSAFPRSPPV